MHCLRSCGAANMELRPQQPCTRPQTAGKLLRHHRWLGGAEQLPTTRQRCFRLPLHSQVSSRVEATDPPVIVKTKQLITAAGRSDVLSLAQGIVHWPPPPAALEVAQQLLSSPTSGHQLHGYGPAEGLPALRHALRVKLAAVNGLTGYDVHVTAGANQGFTNIVLALVDAQDPVVLFKPYYFNHLMALQMSGGADKVVLGPCSPATLHPDLDWLEQQLAGPNPPKMVVLVNPCNPTGVLLSQQEVQRAADLSAAAGAWLVLDNTYKDFVYEGRRHAAVSGEHVLHVFSFSKAYGMMGWRVGYIAFPEAAAGGHLGAALLKVQDTIPICATQLSQHMALAALQHGREYMSGHVAALAGNRAAVAEALSPLGRLGEGVAGGEGAIYYWARLPEGCDDDEAVVEWLIKEHGVCVIPGSSCGVAGHIRVAYANLSAEQCAAAAARLKSGLKQLVADKAVVGVVA